MNLGRDFPPQYLQNCPIIDGKYKVLFKLGTGRFSKVRMGICLATNTKVAIKIMNMRDNEDIKSKQYDTTTIKLFLNEIKMCAQSKHRNIIKIIDFEIGGVYKLPNDSVRHILYYVMKIANYGELHRIIKQSQIFSEKLARSLFRQLILAVEFLHQSRIAHRDIKAENILIDQHMNLKLTDFGCSGYFIDLWHNKIDLDSSEPIGSWKSNAPQLTNCPQNGIYHGDSVDVFACGYVLFQMVMNLEPFKSSNNQDKYYRELTQGNFDKFWKIFAGHCNPSNDFKDLIQKLLDPNPKTRINLKQIKKHPWCMGELLNKNEYKKQMRSQLKKVGAKIRKQQEQQIKTFMKQQRYNAEIGSQIQLIVGREFDAEILVLRELIRHNDHSQTSSNNSNADAKQIKDTKEIEEIVGFRKQ